MAHIEIVRTDLRAQFLKATPKPKLELVDELDEEPRSLSFSELHILLERAKPVPINKYQIKGKLDPNRVARGLSRQQHYHFERLNAARSLQASSADDGVQLSARSALG